MGITDQASILMDATTAIAVPQNRYPMLPTKKWVMPEPASLGAPDLLTSGGGRLRWIPYEAETWDPNGFFTEVDVTVDDEGIGNHTVTNISVTVTGIYYVNFRVTFYPQDPVSQNTNFNEIGNYGIPSLGGYTITGSIATGMFSNPLDTFQTGTSSLASGLCRINAGSTNQFWAIFEGPSGYLLASDGTSNYASSTYLQITYVGTNDARTDPYYRMLDLSGA